jgi:DNA-binding PadR family transcriptional regulator
MTYLSRQEHMRAVLDVLDDKPASVVAIRRRLTAAGHHVSYDSVEDAIRSLRDRGLVRRDRTRPDGAKRYRRNP